MRKINSKNVQIQCDTDEKVSAPRLCMCLLDLKCFHQPLQNISTLLMVIQQCFGKCVQLRNLFDLQKTFDIIISIRMKRKGKWFAPYSILFTSFSSKLYIPNWAKCNDSANFSSAPRISSSVI